MRIFLNLFLDKDRDLRMWVWGLKCGIIVMGW